ncbi:MAG: hypothetical protein DI570_06330 [Phenylobacterium zucineum]|nr:MAG: hypothetical protein DI570_06330 [Phenylobacterium zucineum]
MSPRAASVDNKARWALWLALLAGYLMMLRLNLPGHLSVDSVLALHEGRFNVRTTWNPAIFGWLLGRADSVWRGAGLAVVVSGAVLFGAWAALAALRRGVTWLAPIVALGVIALPQVVIYPGIVWKDVWFAEAGIAGFVVLAFALRSQRLAARLPLLALSALLLAVAGLLRQNGLLLAGAGAVAIAWAGWSRGAGRSVFTAAIWAVSVAVISLLLSIYAQPQGVGRPDGAGSKGLRLLQGYDLVGAAAREPLALSAIDKASPTADDVIRAQARTAYSPERVDTLGLDPKISAALADAPDDALRSEWLDLITRHTGLYLDVRSEVFRQVLMTPVIDRCLPVHVGIAGPDKALAELKMPVRTSREDVRLYNYVTWFLDTPAYAHLTYGVVALAVMGLLLIRREPADLAIAALQGGALAFAASFFVISIACDYRYLYFLDLAAITGVIYLAIDPRLTTPPERRRARR